MPHTPLLSPTTMLNYNHPAIQNLVTERDWRNQTDKEKILGIYNYVRDEIIFGYNISDNIAASSVLADNYGQCNTKGTLFMALLRAVGVECRIHGFYIDKTLQKGAMKGFYYALSPREILHSWVEINYNGEWLNLEGFILDKAYLGALQNKFKACEGAFCGYGVATADFKNPTIEWNENSTYIQNEGIIQDLGIYDTPDELFSAHRQKGGRFKQFCFRYMVRHLMNWNVNEIRKRMQK
ncbi:MAG: transglutaminase family protein [Oscillospiraceae bacterium]|nr:transglutaminase family protein [Oscillospiraceae bacterium]